MTVAELIEYLAKLPQHLPVMVYVEPYDSHIECSVPEHLPPRYITNSRGAKLLAAQEMVAL